MKSGVAAAPDGIKKAYLRQVGALSRHRQGLRPNTARDVIWDLFTYDCWTTIRMGSSHSIKTQLKRGVIQGNPLSPILFNVTLVPIIKAINSGTAGIDVARKNVSILAFADGILLISKNITTAHEQLTMFSSYLTQLGMKLETRKCSISQIKTSNKTWYLADPKLQVGHELLPYANAEEVIRYRGITIRPWTGVNSL